MGIKADATAAEIDRIAHDSFGYESLRPEQERVLKTLLAGHDVLAVMPTGSGKSAIYQIAAAVLPGYAVVVSPLIALQADQVDHLDETDLPAAEVVNSHITASERREAFAELESGGLKYLLLSPEQLFSPKTLEKLIENPPALFVVDEAHCVSEWGHDFRPAYARLGKAVEAFGHPRVLALTATAAPKVREDLVARLRMKKPKTIVTGFDRPNIWLGVETCPETEIKDRLLADRVRAAGRPCIVYVATRQHAEDAARLLAERNVDAIFYHGGMSKTERAAAQEGFMDGGHAVIVATNAFGMGVDKADVRGVVHYDVADSLDTYYQEVGRAGRDGEPARALLLYRPEDLGLQRTLSAGTKVAAEEVGPVLKAVRKAREINFDDLKEKLDLGGGKLAAIVDLLERGGCLTQDIYQTIEASGKVPLAEAVEAAVAEQEVFRAYRRARVDEMRDYAETGECRRRYLLRYFGDADPGPCGNCDNCQTGAADRHAEEAARFARLPFPPKSRVRHRKFGLGQVLRHAEGKVSVLFEEAGEKSIVVEYALEHDLLESVNSDEPR